MQTPATVTNAAASKVYSLLESEQNFDLKLRIAIRGGGCNGFQYTFTFEEAQRDDDHLITCLADDLPNQRVDVIIDPISYLYLTGATIDYLMDTNGERFTVSNPHAKSTCGCGSSFST